MDLVNLAREAHRIAKEKGFYDHCDPEAHLWRQVSHIFIELTEAEVEREPSLYQEEVADVAIVLLDLCQWLNIPLSLHQAPTLSPPMRAAWLAAGRFADALRKGKPKEDLSLWGGLIISYLNMVVPSLETAIHTKLRKNASRPRRYGKAEPLKIS